MRDSLRFPHRSCRRFMRIWFTFFFFRIFTFIAYNNMICIFARTNFNYGQYCIHIGRRRWSRKRIYCTYTAIVVTIVIITSVRRTFPNLGAINGYIFFKLILVLVSYYILANCFRYIFVRLNTSIPTGLPTGAMYCTIS